MSRIRHSVCKWCHDRIPLEDLCIAARDIGLESIMEGDVIRTIQRHHQFIVHYHTGGCPGRHEIDESQELYYPAILRAIAATGYTGFVGQEFVPTPADPLASLRRGVEICSV